MLLQKLLHRLVCFETVFFVVEAMPFVLFDEIEKASDSLWQLLLGILDKATLTLGDNRRVDFSKTIVIMTSNLGAREMADMISGGIGFAPTKTDRARIHEIWQRFPKFVLGFAVTFLAGLYLALGTPPAVAAKIPAAVAEANTFRIIFFILTFFSIGLISNFHKLWQEGIGKLAAVYVVSLFGFVIWVGLLISWLFFSGIKPPLAS